jgi:predicted aldo/keto reductase-like oxidoreductase
MATESETIEIRGESSVDWQSTAMQYIELNKQKTEAIQRVRELHNQETEITSFCKECSYTYPCPTIEALDGEQG